MPTCLCLPVYAYCPYLPVYAYLSMPTCLCLPICAYLSILPAYAYLSIPTVCANIYAYLSVIWGKGLPDRRLRLI